MATVTWYFDFISPYSYFGLRSLQQLPAGTQVQLQPILFAGLLNHWGQKGPAEIAPKRIWTYRSCIWWAQRNGVPFRMPAAHPFNSLPYLRMSIAAGNTREAIGTLFDALWTSGADPGDPQVIASAARAAGVGMERLADAQVKQSLREATERAAKEGVFGVPTLRIDGELFWGNDAVDFAAAYLRDPAILRTDAMQQAAAMPVGAARTSS